MLSGTASREDANPAKVAQKAGLPGAAADPIYFAWSARRFCAAAMARFAPG
jgi:hypothetical protein